MSNVVSDPFYSRYDFDELLCCKYSWEDVFWFFYLRSDSPGWDCPSRPSDKNKLDITLYPQF